MLFLWFLLVFNETSNTIRENVAVGMGQNLVQIYDQGRIKTAEITVHPRYFDAKTKKINNEFDFYKLF